jgi:hypothetical protein
VELRIAPSIASRPGVRAAPARQPQTSRDQRGRLLRVSTAAGAALTVGEVAVADLHDADYSRYSRIASLDCVVGRGILAGRPVSESQRDGNLGELSLQITRLWINIVPRHHYIYRS